MGKKKDMSAYKEEFCDGAVKQGYDREKAGKLFELIEKFAGYGFNKSHSAAYAMITFQTAYLKCYYPQEFMAALLTSEKDNTDKVVKYIDEVKRLGIELLAPSINKSVIEFSAINTEDDKEAILFGLGAIKGVGESAISKILEARSEREFDSLDDFISRIDTSKVNKKVIESLIKSGSLDEFGYSRRALLEHIEEIIKAAQESARAKKMAENSLFGDDVELTNVKVEISNMPEYDLKKLLELEKETIGFYISGHPLDEFKEEIDEIDYTLSSEIENLGDGSEALFIGKIESMTEKISKKGNKFTILSLMDFHGSIELTIFSKMVQKLENMNKEKPICFKVSIGKDDRGVNIRVLKILELEDAKKEKTKIKQQEVQLEPKVISIDIQENEVEKLEKLYQTVQQNYGKRALKLILNYDDKKIVIETRLAVSDEIDNALKEFEWCKVS
jgi:DNA polymerase-3 subunit alpha